jgi:hypothetical protein
MVYTNSAYHDEIYLGMTAEEFDAQYPDWRVSVDDGTATTNT